MHLKETVYSTYIHTYVYTHTHTPHVSQEGDFDLHKRTANCLIKPKAINNKYSWLKA